MKLKYLHLLMLISLASCASAPKKEKEYEWINPDGELASEEEIAAVMEKCKWSEKVAAAQSEMRTAISVARYESQYGSKTSDKYTQAATQHMLEARACILKEGFTSREKITSQP